MSRRLFILNSFIFLLLSGYSHSNNEKFGTVSGDFDGLRLQQGPNFAQQPENVVVRYKPDEIHCADYVCCSATVCCACACYYYPWAIAGCSIASCCGCACYTGAKSMPVIVAMLSYNFDIKPKKME